MIPARVMTVPIDRSSWPQISTMVKPIPTQAVIAMVLVIVVRLNGLKNFGANSAMKTKTTAKMM